MCQDGASTLYTGVGGIRGVTQNPFGTTKIGVTRTPGRHQVGSQASFRVNDFAGDLNDEIANNALWLHVLGSFCRARQPTK